MTADFKHKTVWILGASAGIGAALAHELAVRGASIVASARSAQALNELVAKLPGAGHMALPVDVSDRAGFEAAAAALPDVDVAFYNAGVYYPQLVDEMKCADMLSTIDINLAGAFLMLDKVLPAMISRKAGRVVLVSSVAGYCGLPRSLAYGASKAGLISLAESLRIELAPKGVVVQVVCPGFVRTRLTEQNSFPMPFMITTEKAAKHIANGMLANRFEIHFPKVFTYVMKTLAFIPRSVRFFLLRRAV